MPTDGNLSLCRCGVEAEEDWEYCSRECGVAAALERLTAGVASHTNQEGSTHEDELTVDTFLESLRSARSLWNKKHSVSYLLDDPHRVDDSFSIEECDTGEEEPSVIDQTLLPPAAHSRNFSFETTGSSSNRDTSGSDTSFPTPATSISSGDFRLPLPEDGKPIPKTAPLSFTQKVRRVPPRSRTSSQLKVDYRESHSLLGPEKSPFRKDLISSNTALASELSLLASSFGETFLDEGVAIVGPDEWDVILGSQEDDQTVQGSNASLSSSDENLQRARRHIHKAWAGRKEGCFQTSLLRDPQNSTMTRRVSSSTLARRTSAGGSRIPVSDPYSTTLLHTLKKMSSRVFSKVNRNSPRHLPPAIDIGPVVDIGPSSASSFMSSPTHDTTAALLPPIELSRNDNSSFAISAFVDARVRHAPSDVPTSPTASPSSAATTSSIAGLLNSHDHGDTQFMLTKRRESERSVSHAHLEIALDSSPWPELIAAPTKPWLHERGEKSRPVTPYYPRENDGGSTQDSPVLGPGQPVYLEVREATDHSYVRCFSASASSFESANIISSSRDHI